MRAFNTKGPDGAAALCPPFSDYVFNLHFAGAGAKTVTWPAQANRCVISSTADYYVRADGSAAAAPLADVTDGTASALNVPQRTRAGETTFSVYSGTAQDITIEFWSDQIAAS